MELVKITAENADDFTEHIDADVRCNIGRSFFKGIGALGDNYAPLGAVVYEILNYDSEADTKCRIHSFMAADDDTAKALMEEYSNAIAEDGAIESLYETGDENLDRIFSSYGFTSKKRESPEIVVTVGELQKVAAMAKGKNMPEYIQSMTDVSLLQYRSFLKNCLIKGRFGLLEDLGYLPLAWFEREISSCSIADEKLDGVLLIRRLPSQTLVPCLFTAFGIDYQKNLVIIMLRSAQKVVEMYPEETRVVIRRHSPGVKQLTDKFFAGKKGAEVFVGRRAEG